MKVSIIIPVYRVPEKYLRKCIESCINQTLDNIEIIIVHDVANDNCGVICDEYSKKNRNIRVIHKNGETNGGLSAARNDGVRAACGEWITYVDGDDQLEPDACEKMYLIAEKESDIDVLITKEYKDYDGRLEPYIYDYIDGEIFVGKDCIKLQRDVLNFNKFISGVYAKLIRRDFLISHSIFHNESLKCGVEGLEYSIRLYGEAGKVKFADIYTYHYIYNDVSLSANSSNYTNGMVILGFKEILNNIEEINDSELTYNFYSRILHAIITIAISGCFNPMKKITFNQRKKDFKQYVDNELCQEALKRNNNNTLSKIKKITIFFIKNNHYRCVYFLAKIRAAQLQIKKRFK